MQKVSIKKIILPGAIFLFISFACREKVKIVSHPIPEGETVTDEYSVRINGKQVDCYMALTQHHDNKYYFASFDFSGKIKVEVTSKARS